ncbi:Exosortase A system-associated hydrolase 1 [Solimicrobium silvestre]|uniref:Exosortase A system-associated hydrolase 1 n=2 Tax=Solimicrobium silvestre TaxID=2099400 RepID=A0A2S9GTB9_9BURK|nr:Exosortase A system-associated hydrolase 1 [Solimicrobium silvestre]
MHYEEMALSFTCQSQQLVGVLSQPEQAGQSGVLIIVGGPQYRAGSHRQFTLLARQLAARGIPVMRFDYRGMGDSTGEPINFDNIDADLSAALDYFCAIAPSIQSIVLWGLCDGATAAALYAQHDPRISGIVMLNPWIRTEQGLAKAYLKHYYPKRLLQADFWKKVFGGKFNVLHAATSLFQQLKPAHQKETAQLELPERMLAGLQNFNGRVLLILSGQDLTAKEFTEVSSTSPQWKKFLKQPQVCQHELAAADHTFSRRAWRDQVAGWTAAWLMEN